MKECNSLTKNATVFEAEEAWEQDCFLDGLHSQTEREENFRSLFLNSQHW